MDVGGNKFHCFSCITPIAKPAVVVVVLLVLRCRLPEIRFERLFQHFSVLMLPRDEMSCSLFYAEGFLGRNDRIGICGLTDGRRRVSRLERDGWSFHQQELLFGHCETSIRPYCGATQACIYIEEHFAFRIVKRWNLKYVVRVYWLFAGVNHFAIVDKLVEIVELVGRGETVVVDDMDIA